jgi:4-hydroxy-3-polyprenylbenzoate decarboxylase
MTTRPIVLGISGASGAIYGVRLLEKLAALHVDVHLVVTRWGRRTIEHETGLTVRDLERLVTTVVAEGDQSALVASGSFRTAGMVVAPCSAKSLAAIATGLADNLLVRAADVTLKERRRLILLFRETPLHEVHLENMLRVTRMGGIIMPPVPAFYQLPKTVDDIVDHTVTRVLDLFDLDTDSITAASGRWDGQLGSQKRI